MSVLVSILGWLGISVASLVVLLGLASLWPVRVRIEGTARGGSGTVSWLGWTYRQDRHTRTWELRLARWRLVRRPLGDDRADRPSDSDAEKRDTSKDRRSRLSAAAILRLGRSAGREARRIVRRIHVERLSAGLVIATPDPALTGELYGYGAAIAATTRGAWPAARIDLEADFLATTPRGGFDAAIRTRPMWWAASAIRVGWMVLRERWRSRRTRRSAGRRYRPCNLKTSSSR